MVHGAIRTDITVTTITHTITMAMAGTHTATTMDTADTVTMVGPVTDTAMAADQGISGVCGVGDSPDTALLKSPRLLRRVDNDADHVDPSDMACATNITTCHRESDR
jgi:hypothetical protein